MEPLSAHPVKTKALGLADLLARERGFRLGDHNALRDGLSDIASEKFPAHLLHGKRVEAMFGYILAELDFCRLIKEEDAGETLVQPGSEVAIPDYRVFTKDDRMLLVEVKNVHGRGPKAPLAMKRAYVDALKAYGRLNSCRVLVAAYWSRWNMWTLVDLDALKPQGARLKLTLPEALIANRMGEVGDYSIGVRTPLRLRLLCDPVQVAFGQPDVQFRVRASEIYCADSLLTEKHEQAIAYFLMLFGQWQGPGAMILDEERVMTGVEFVAAPEEPNEKSGFDIVGAASGLLSKAYRYSTVSAAGAIERLRPSSLPSSITNVLPNDYRSEAMPLWRLTQVQDDSPSAVGRPRSSKA